jgi:hypothetical protein
MAHTWSSMFRFGVPAKDINQHIYIYQYIDTKRCMHIFTSTIHTYTYTYNIYTHTNTQAHTSGLAIYICPHTTICVFKPL